MVLASQRALPALQTHFESPPPQPPVLQCGLLICDEAHRLKNKETKTAIALAALPTRKRILLSGEGGQLKAQHPPPQGEGAAKCQRWHLVGKCARGLEVHMSPALVKRP